MFIGHTNENLLTVQLGEDTDSKSMLGSYHCTDIPGEFVWQPGVLTKVFFLFIKNNNLLI